MNKEVLKHWKCNYSGDKDYRKFLDKPDYYTKEEIMEFLTLFCIDNKTAPFVVFFNMTVSKEELQTKNNPDCLVKKVKKYIDEAELAPEGKIQYIKLKRFEIIQSCNQLTHLWWKECGMKDIMNSTKVEIGYNALYHYLINEGVSRKEIFNLYVVFQEEKHAIELLNNIIDPKVDADKQTKFLIKQSQKQQDARNKCLDDIKEYIEEAIGVYFPKHYTSIQMSVYDFLDNNGRTNNIQKIAKPTDCVLKLNDLKAFIWMIYNKWAIYTQSQNMSKLQTSKYIPLLRGLFSDWSNGVSDDTITKTWKADGIFIKTR